MTYPLVPLGEVLRHRSEFIQIDDAVEYKRCRVQLHAQGIVLRDLVQGIQIKTKRQQVCRQGELLVAEIDAKVGGVGVVPPDLDEAVVSSHYFLYEVDAGRLDTRFLDYCVRSRRFRDQVEARGSTNYAAIRACQVLDYTVPLPSIDEQRRIVGRLDELLGKVGEARRVRAGVVTLAEVLWKKVLAGLLSDPSWLWLRLKDVLLGDLRNGFSPKSTPMGTARCLRLSAVRDGEINPAEAKPVSLSPREFDDHQVRQGDVFVMRGSGSKRLVGVAARMRGPADGITIFPDLLVRVPLDSAMVDPGFFTAVWNSPLVREQLEEAAKTTSGIWKLNQGHLEEIRIPVPPKSEQVRVCGTLDDLAGCLTRVASSRQNAEATTERLPPAILDAAFSGRL